MAVGFFAKTKVWACVQTHTSSPMKFDALADSSNLRKEDSNVGRHYLKLLQKINIALEADDYESLKNIVAEAFALYSEGHLDREGLEHLRFVASR